MTKKQPEQVAYITTTEAAAKSGCCSQRIRALIAQHRIPGVRRHGPTWMVPADFQVLPGEHRQRRMTKIGARKK